MNVLAVYFCQQTVKGWRIAGMIITILRIMVPLIIIITSSIPIFNAVIKGTLEELTGSWIKIGKKLIAGILVFFIPTIISASVEMLANRELVSDDVLICSSCFDLPNSDKCKGYVTDFDNEEKEDIKKFKQDSIKGSVDSSEYKDGQLPDADEDNDGGHNNNNGSNNNQNNNGNQNNAGDLTSKIQNYINNNSAGGTWSVYVKNMSNGQTVNINSGNQQTSASIIKLFIMAATYDQISKNAISETSTLKSNLNSMIIVSSNEATNAVINSLPGGMSTVNSYNSANGYNSTSLNRFLGGSRTPENVTSAQDVGKLLEKIYKGELPHSDEMLNMLKNQQVRHKIPSGISDNVVVANKTGELSDVENDSAIVYSGGDYVLVVLSQGVNNVSKAQETVRGISSIVYGDYK